MNVDDELTGFPLASLNVAVIATCRSIGNVSGPALIVRTASPEPGAGKKLLSNDRSRPSGALEAESVTSLLNPSGTKTENGTVTDCALPMPTG